MWRRTENGPATSHEQRPALGTPNRMNLGMHSPHGAVGLKEGSGGKPTRTLRERRVGGEKNPRKQKTCRGATAWTIRWKGAHQRYTQTTGSNYSKRKKLEQASTQKKKQAANRSETKASVHYTQMRHTKKEESRKRMVGEEESTGGKKGAFQTTKKKKSKSPVQQSRRRPPGRGKNVINVRISKKRKESVTFGQENNQQGALLSNGGAPPRRKKGLTREDKKERVQRALSTNESTGTHKSKKDCRRGKKNAASLGDVQREGPVQTVHSKRGKDRLLWRSTTDEDPREKRPQAIRREKKKRWSGRGSPAKRSRRKKESRKQRRQEGEVLFPSGKCYGGERCRLKKSWESERKKKGKKKGLPEPEGRGGV